MLPPKNRLTKKKDFDAIFRGGKSIKSGPFLFKVLKNNLAQSRVGFLVSKKVANKAHDRNILKRRLRAIIAPRIGSIHPPMDIMLVALPGATKKDFTELRILLNKIF